MSSSWLSLIGYCGTLIITVVMAYLSYLTDFIIPASSTAGERLLLTALLTIASFLLGDYTTKHFMQKELNNNLVNEVSKRLANFQEAMTVSNFSTCHEAMEYITTQVPLTKEILNTKIAKVESNEDRGEDGIKNLKYAEPYIAAVMKALRSKDFIYKDVRSKAFSKSARQLRDYSKNIHHNYHCTTVSGEFPSFINFCVLKYRSGHSEVVIGWATTRHEKFEQPAFRITYPGLVAYYEHYHGLLMTNGEEL